MIKSVEEMMSETRKIREDRNRRVENDDAEEDTHPVSSEDIEDHLHEETYVKKTWTHGH